MPKNAQRHNNSLPGPTYIVGFGSQAQAWAANLTDSGRDVCVILRENSSSLHKVKSQGIALASQTLENFSASEPIRLLLLTPDESHQPILQQLKHLPAGSEIVYAHGHSFVRHKLDEKFPQWRHALLAPKAIASEVRRRYREEEAIGAVYDLRGAGVDEKSRDELLELAKDLGVSFGPHKSSFEEETLADLFSEQSLLCSLIPYGAKKSYEKLIEKGISPEVAYLECWFEVKLIVDALMKMGPQKFFDMISPNAFFGGQKAAELFFDQDFDKKLDQLYQDIESGAFDQQIESSSLDELRKKVNQDWENSPLNRAHQQWGEELFGGKS